MASIRKKETKKGTKWELDFYVGSKRLRRTFDTRREAEEAKREVLFGVSASVESDLRPQDLKAGIRFYLETISVNKASSEQEVMYSKELYRSLRLQGCTMFHEVRPEHLEKLKNELLAKKKSSTVNRQFNTYRHIFTKAVTFGWTLKNPSKSVATVPEAKNPRRVWTDEELETVIAHVPEWAGDVLRGMNFLGAGQAELKRLTWGDVDFERREVWLVRKKGTGEERRRKMPLFDELAEFLEMKLKRARASRRAKTTDLVFVNSRGKPIDTRQLAVLVRRAVRFNGLPEGTVAYGVRHKFATELLEAGVGEESVRRLMGHMDVRTLIENYAHVRDEALREAMAVRSQQVKKGSGGTGR